MLHLISAEVGRNDLRVIETGAGLSTLALLSMGWQVTSVSPDQALGPRIETYAERTAIGREGWEHIVRRSELALPLLMDRSYDVALMDGGRGWPTVFVDFCYLNAILRKGGLLLIDDAQLHSVRELVELLRAQPGYRLVRDRTKLRAFAKETDERYLPGLDGEPYLQPNPG
jgi:predicted O-methyltransferase YrrM